MSSPCCFVTAAKSGPQLSADKVEIVSGDFAAHSLRSLLRQSGQIAGEHLAHFAACDADDVAVRQGLLRHSGGHDAVGAARLGGLGGVAVDGGILWCVTELVSKAQLDKAVAIVKEVL